MGRLAPIAFATAVSWGAACPAWAQPVDLLRADAEIVDETGEVHFDLRRPAARSTWTRDVREGVVDVEIPPGVVGVSARGCAGRGELGRARRSTAIRLDVDLVGEPGAWVALRLGGRRLAGFRMVSRSERRRVVVKGGELDSARVVRVRGPRGIEVTGLGVSPTTCRDAGAELPTVDVRGATLPPKSALRWIAEPDPDDQLVLRARAVDGTARLSVRIHSDLEVPLTPALVPTITVLDGTWQDLVIPLDGGDARQVEVGAAAGRVELSVARIDSRDAREPAELPPVDNVVVLLIDTLRADRLSPLSSHTRVRTPALAELVSRGGVVFEAAYAQANWTKPSVATLLTGLFPWQHGATTHRAVVDPSVPFLTEQLQRAGVETAGFVANGYVSDRFGLALGFDRFEHAADTGRATGLQQVSGLLRWLDERRRRRDRPGFFAYVHTIDVHWPYTPPPSILQQYDPAHYEGPITSDCAPLLLRRIESGEVTPDARDRQRLVAMYDAGVAAQDDVIDRMFRGLEHRGLLSSTLVIIVADHGEELFDRGSVGHGGVRMWDEQLRIPMFVFWPGAPARRVRAAVGLVDIAPTIFDALSVEHPPWLAGRSLAPLVAGGAPPRDLVVAAGARNVAAVVSRDYKMHWDGALAGDVRVYRRGVDVVERSDLAVDHPLAVRHLREELGEIRAETPAVGAASEPRVDAEMAAHLRALGYVE